MPGATRRPRSILLPIAAGLAMLAAGPGCSGFQGTTSTSFLRTVRDDPDPNKRYAAYAKLGSSGSYDDEAQMRKAVDLLIQKLGEGKEPVATRAVICRTLGELGDPRSRAAVAKAADDPEAIVRAEACRSLGRVGLAEDATLLARVMTLDPQGDCRIAAIEGLGALKSTDPRIHTVLIAGMENADPGVRYASLQALRSSTGRDLGVLPGPWRDDLQAREPSRIATRPAAARDPAAMRTNR